MTRFTASTEETQALFSPAAPFFVSKIPPKDLRDEFAMAALIGYMADSTIKCEADKDFDEWAMENAIECYQLANAMMKARTKETT